MTLLWVVMGAVLLAFLHLVGPKVHFITYVPRSWWLSFAGGISVAYVFLHLLPELARGSRVVAEELSEVPLAEHAVWLVALAGLVALYGLESVARRSRVERTGEGATSPVIFWLSISSYSIYNMLIAYLLRQQAEQGLAALALFVAAMGLHFLVNDFALREHHKQRYMSVGRWILVASIVLGGFVGAVAEIHEAIIVAGIALIAGGVVLNVLKEELPEEAESRFEAFGAGVLTYAGLLLAA